MSQSEKKKKNEKMYYQACVEIVSLFKNKSDERRFVLQLRNYQTRDQTIFTQLWDSSALIKFNKILLNIFYMSVFGNVFISQRNRAREMRR